MTEEQSTGRACQWYGVPEPDETADHDRNHDGNRRAADQPDGNQPDGNQPDGNQPDGDRHLAAGVQEGDPQPEAAHADPLWWAARGHSGPARPGTHVAFNR
jgi:hypothetical protein